MIPRMEAALPRALWHGIETVNAVAYFSPESREAPVRLGLKGFWMGYFACRAAPLGPVAAGVVEATFFNFHPDRVRRAIPDAWATASPADILETAPPRRPAATGATPSNNELMSSPSRLTQPWATNTSTRSCDCSGRLPNRSPPRARFSSRTPWVCPRPRPTSLAEGRHGPASGSREICSVRPLAAGMGPRVLTGWRRAD